MRIEISKIEDYLAQEAKQKQQQKGINVKEISGAEAKRFLGR